MKTLFATALLFVAALSPAIQFSEIQNWTGTGTNQAGVVLQWDLGDSPQALAWGVRFDGTLTGTQLWDALQSDPRLFAYQENVSWGRAIYGIGYDWDNDSNDGFTTGASIDAATANDPEDRWQVGWLTNGFWSLWTGSGSSTGAWASAQTGVDGLTIQNENWMLLAFAPASNGWSTTPATDIAPATAVPEPATLLLLGIGIAALRKRTKPTR